MLKLVPRPGRRPGPNSRSCHLKSTRR